MKASEGRQWEMPRQSLFEQFVFYTFEPFLQILTHNTHTHIHTHTHTHTHTHAHTYILICFYYIMWIL